MSDLQLIVDFLFRCLQDIFVVCSTTICGVCIIYWLLGMVVKIIKRFIR